MILWSRTIFARSLSATLSASGSSCLALANSSHAFFAPSLNPVALPTIVLVRLATAVNCEISTWTRSSRLSAMGVSYANPILGESIHAHGVVVEQLLLFLSWSIAHDALERFNPAAIRRP